MVTMAKKANSGTPALRVLESAGTSFDAYEYEHDPRYEGGFGKETATRLGIAPERVFKTLLADVDGHLVCAIVPASGMLDLKALAGAVDGKRAAMADPAQAERATGYVVGGISPLGQKQPHRTVIDTSAQGHATVLVSGGKRGLSVELAPADLAVLTHATFAAIGR